MAKRRRVRFERVIILILCAALVIGAAVFGVSFVSKYLSSKKDDPQNNVNVDPEPVETSKNVKVSLLDYQVYTDDSGDLGFSFIVAVIKFEGEGPVSFDLGNLQTSEKIYLNNVSKYLNALEEKSYRISKLQIVNTVVSENDPYTCNIFIPYTTDSQTLRVLNSDDASMIPFDLNRNVNDVSQLKFETQQQIEVGDASVTVSSCSVSTMMLHNDMEYQVPATMSVYTFSINVAKADGDVVIEDARFVRDSDGEVIGCMDASYRSVKIENCLGKKLTPGENGALFFETLSVSGDPDYSGNLLLQFSNSSDWVKIPTVLE